MRAIYALLLVIVAVPLALAQTPSVEFGGQRYIKKKETDGHCNPASFQSHVGRLSVPNFL